MLCVSVSGSSFVVAPPSSQCAATDYVLLTVMEASSLGSSPFKMTMAEGGAISGAVLMVWVVGWAIRTAIRLIRDTHGSAVDNGE